MAEIISSDSWNLMDKCWLLQVSLSRFGDKRTLPVSKISVAADKTFIHASKTLFKSTAYALLKRADGELGQWLRAMTLPGPFKAGIYLLPKEMLDQVNAHLKEYSEVTRPALVSDFVAEYPDKLNEAKEALGPECFDPFQYPEPDALPACFTMVYRVFNFSTPIDLPEEIRKRESEKLVETFVSAREECVAALRVGFSELISHMVDRLSPNADGSQKTFRNTLTGNFKEFMDAFGGRNSAVGDAELAALVEQAKSIIEGVDPQTLRDHKGVRNTVREELSAVKTVLDGMLQDKPGRKINFDDMAEASPA